MIRPVRGGTFLFRAGAGDLHLHICLTEAIDVPTLVPQQILVVNASTVRNIHGEDRTCILNSGDHPFIRVESYIPYSRWRLIPLGDLNKSESLGMAKEQEPISEAVLLRIEGGLWASNRVPKVARDFLNFYKKLKGGK